MHDMCLIQTPKNEYGIFEDLSPQFESIPCLPETLDLEKVKSNFEKFLTNVLTSVSWEILLGRRLGPISN